MYMISYEHDLMFIGFFILQKNEQKYIRQQRAEYEKIHSTPVLQVYCGFFCLLINQINVFPASDLWRRTEAPALKGKYRY